jgi:hypothetical protein
MKEKTVHPSDDHPNHPANQAELVARYGYISPNQFPAIDELGRTDPMFKGIVDETFDIEEAEKIAQDLAKDLGQSVTVDVTDENGESLDPLTFDAHSAEIEL